MTRAPTPSKERNGLIPLEPGDCFSPPLQRGTAWRAPAKRPAGREFRAALQSGVAELCFGMRPLRSLNLLPQIGHVPDLVPPGSVR
jgi:hypothetical protein